MSHVMEEFKKAFKENHRPLFHNIKKEIKNMSRDTINDNCDVNNIKANNVQQKFFVYVDSPTKNSTDTQWRQQNDVDRMANNNGNDSRQSILKENIYARGQFQKEQTKNGKPNAFLFPLTLNSACMNQSQQYIKTQNDSSNVSINKHQRTLFSPRNGMSEFQSHSSNITSLNSNGSAAIGYNIGQYYLLNMDHIIKIQRFLRSKLSNHLDNVATFRNPSNNQKLYPSFSLQQGSSQDINQNVSFNTSAFKNNNLKNQFFLENENISSFPQKVEQQNRTFEKEEEISILSKSEQLRQQQSVDIDNIQCCFYQEDYPYSNENKIQEIPILELPDNLQRNQQPSLKVQENHTVESLKQENNKLKKIVFKMKLDMKSQLEEGLVQQRNQMKSINDEYVQFISKIVQDKKDLAKRCENLQKENAVLIDQNQFLAQKENEDGNILRNQLEELRSRESELLLEIESKKKKIEESGRKSGEQMRRNIEEAMNEVVQARSQVQQALRDAEEQKNIAQERQLSIQKLQHEKEKQEDEISKNRNEIEILKKRNEDTESSFIKIKGVNEELQKSIDNKRKVEEEKSELEKKFIKMQQDHYNITEQNKFKVEQYQREIQQLKDINQLSQSDTKSTADQKLNEILSLKQLIEEIKQQQKKDIQKMEENHRSIIKRLEDENETTKNQFIKQITEKVEDLEEELIQEKNQVHSLQKQIFQLQQNKKDAKNEQNDHRLQQEIDKTKGYCSNMDSIRIEELETLISQMDEERKQACEMVKKMKEAHELMRNKYEEEIKQIKQRYSSDFCSYEENIRSTLQKKDLSIQRLHMVIDNLKNSVSASNSP